jgi:Glycosyltransferases involved in cell wall biogenesis
LVTYVFNDGELADGLLEHVGNWTMKPAEIIIVDDGSEVPYIPQPIAGLPPTRGSP